MASGLFRVGYAWAHVQIADGTVISVSKSDYEAAGHKPQFWDLPTKEMYDTWVRNNPSSGGVIT
ncbi:hypothetical protein BH10PSE7_BH10PSE7_00880 [soil metagenome]